MLKSFDRGVAILMALGAGIGHTYGSLTIYADQPVTQLWALNASVLGVLIGMLHLLRTFRRGDMAIALLAILGSLCWIGSCVRFGALIGHPFDKRVVVFIAESAILIAFGVVDLMRAQSLARAQVTVSPPDATSAVGNAAL